MTVMETEMTLVEVGKTEVETEVIVMKTEVTEVHV